MVASKTTEFTSLIVLVIVYFSNEHYIAPATECLLADSCNHTWIPECGKENNCLHVRLFLDECTRHELNCDNNTDYIKVAMAECEANETTTVISTTTSTITTAPTTTTTTTTSPTTTTTTPPTTTTVTKPTETTISTALTTASKYHNCKRPPPPPESDKNCSNHIPTTKEPTQTTTSISTITESTTTETTQTTSSISTATESTTTEPTQTTTSITTITESTTTETTQTTSSISTATESTTTEPTQTTTSISTTTESTTTEPTSTTRFVTTPTTTISETTRTISTPKPETTKQVVSRKPCQIKGCAIPLTWETTAKGEVRDFYQILREKFGTGNVVLLRATTHWPRRIGRMKSQEDFIFGKHVDIEDHRMKTIEWNEIE